MEQELRKTNRGKDPMNRLVYDIFTWVINIILDLFFREVHPRSSWRIPRNGPVLFVAAPHANQFVDPVLLMRVILHEAGRPVAFLTAAKSMKRKFIGHMAKLMGAVPVSRAMDDTKKMPGRVSLSDPDGDATLIRGVNTNFKDAAFQVGGLLVLPKVKGESASAEISEIISATELRLKKPFKQASATNQLTGRQKVVPDGKEESDLPDDFEGTEFLVAPKIDQGGVYSFVSETLGKGGCIGMFPEGGSHDRTELLPLKAGVAIMALETMSKYPECDLQILPCGMNYFHAHKFRSRCVVEFGAPIQVSDEDVKRYQSGERRAIIGKVLDDIHAAVRTVTLNTPDYETLMLIQATRRLYKPEGTKLPITMVMELNRRLIRGYEKYKDDARISKLKSGVMAYNKQLLALQIRDHQVRYAQMGYLKALWLLVSRLIKLAVMSLLVIPGLVLFAPIFILGKIISIRKSREALAGSTVKVAGRDVVATWKLLVSLAATPAFYVFYISVACSWYLYNNGNGYLPEGLSVLGLGFFLFVLLAGASFAALRIGEVGMDIVKSIRPLLVALSPFHGRQLQKLRDRRAELSAEVTELINTLGPEMFPDFNSRRIVRPKNIDSKKANRLGPPSVDYASDSEQSNSDPHTPNSPATPLYAGYSHARHLSRNESFHNLSSIPMFSSHPSSRTGTPHQARSLSRSGSFGAGEAVKGFTPLTDMDEVHKRIQSGLRERSVRRKSGSGWDSGASTPGSEFDGLTMTKKHK